jgi:hypothetical protein
MRKAMAMIELIFAIVIMAVAVMTIPSMMNIAGNATKGMTIDEDVMSRMAGWTIDKFQARWDRNYGIANSGPLWVGGECSRGTGNVWFRANISSEIECDDKNRSAAHVSGAIYSDGNTTLGIERLNGGTETISITPADGGAPYAVTATYSVAYVNSAIAVSGNTATATWTLGSSANMNPSPSGTSNLKRVVTQFSSPADELDVSTTLTFFKSNKGN